MSTSSVELPVGVLRGHEEHEHDPRLAHHFDTMETQYHSAKLGMWLFLATEILLFSGLFVAYSIYRALHHEIFLHASHLLDVKMGGLNTAVLIGSSLSMALAVRAAQLSQKKWLIINLLITLTLAGGFLVVKYFEYTHKFHMGIFPGRFFSPDLHAREIEEYIVDSKGQPLEYVRNFFSIYYLLTGLHGLHVLFGMGAITWVLVRSFLGKFSSAYYYPVECVGLYWHLVDLIWIYLFPLLYLIDLRHG
jgi:cytochrome c oxidase subunit III